MYNKTFRLKTFIIYRASQNDESVPPQNPIEKKITAAFFSSKTKENTAGFSQRARFLSENSKTFARAYIYTII